MLDFGFAYLADLGTAGAEPAMRELSAALGQSVLLAVLGGHDVRHVARANAPRVLHLTISIGERSPAHVTSAGRMPVADLPEEDRARWLEAVQLRPHTRHPTTSLDVLREELDVTRRRRWAHSASELDIGMEGVAVPVQGSDRPTALSVLFPATRCSREEHEHEVVPPLLHQRAPRSPRRPARSDGSRPRVRGDAQTAREVASGNRYGRLTGLVHR